MREKIIDKHLEALFLQATIGIEKEGQRVTTSGAISQKVHPKAFGSRDYHPYIQTDFAESQLELISPVSENETEALRFLGAIHEVALRHLPEGEVLWPLSMPAKLPNEADILEAQMDDEAVSYREYLTKKYGKYKQMVSGIHYNFGFKKEFLLALKDDNQSLADIQNQVYMKLARQFVRYQWLLIYLLGATPLAPEGYYGEEEGLKSPARSIRACRYGYVNPSYVEVDFSDITSYVKTLRRWVDTGELIAEKEFYSSVRFRGAKTVKDFPDKGVQYMEFRLFDLNPFAAYGMTVDDARFVHLFLLLMLWLDEENPKTAVPLGKEKSEAIATSHPLSSPLYLAEGEWLFERFREMAEQLSLATCDLDLIAEKESQLKHPERTVGGRLWQAYEKTGSMLSLGLTLAKDYQALAAGRPFGLKAFSSMELSTQILLADAIQYGFQLEVLDESDQFVKLSYKDHIEYVKNGNMTAHDTYISPLIMENKVVTKKVLAEAGFAVPASIQVKNLTEAQAIFPLIKEKPIVIKPKSTNYGLGISIFQDGANQLDDFLQAVALALKEDVEVMVEDYLEGTEYRFFVLNGETRAVLLRVPAHVEGDGKSTIADLVAQKNANPLRGDGKSTPLKAIELGEIEQLQLKSQGYTVDSVVGKGNIAYLRANSNVSTGGDSIDMTDEVHPSYKEIAAQITSAMKAKVCGVDLIIPDITQPANHQAQNYGIIEANFNPMMMMHIFPAKGKSRRLTTDILKMLYPEYPWN